MGRIVFAWEFGGGMGHIQRILPLAKKMQERKHEVICAMKHVIQAEKIMMKHNIKIIQAPVWQVKIKQLPTSYNYPDTLLNLGYRVIGGSLSMAKAWRNLFDLIKPDLIIADHAPTALVATHGSGYKRVLYGTGFLTPPRKSPMPSIIPWVKPPEGIMEYSENKVVEIINDVIKKLGGPPLQKLYNLFEVDENILATFEELDHYQNREPAKYWGEILSLPEGDNPQWPQKSAARKKIFCYLKPSYPLLEKFLEELREVDAATIIYSPQLRGAVIKKMQSPNLVFLKKPANMHKVCEECDLVICHAGHGTSAVSLLHGKPLLLLPEQDHLEQMLTGYNLANSKYGIVITTKMKDRLFMKAIEELLHNPVFTDHAQKFAEKYKDFTPERQLEEIVERCEEVLKPDAEEKQSVL